jgi:hypothetical protein
MVIIVPGRLLERGWIAVQNLILVNAINGHDFNFNEVDSKGEANMRR